MTLPLGAEQAYRDEASLCRAASEFAKLLQPGEVCLLEGELGAGKTFFTTAVYRALGGRYGGVSSPTFNLVHVYPLPHGRFFFHVDLYRVRSLVNADDLGQENWLEPGQGYSFIEWAERLGGCSPERGWRLFFSHIFDGGRGLRIERLGRQPASAGR